MQAITVNVTVKYPIVCIKGQWGHPEDREYSKKDDVTFTYITLAKPAVGDVIQADGVDYCITKSVQVLDPSFGGGYRMGVFECIAREADK